MDLKDSIKNMILEIQSYSGDFGDPIVDLVNFDPIAILTSNHTTNVRMGACIGLLVNFSSYIDNSTFEDAQNSKAAQDIDTALQNDLCTEFPKIHLALKYSKVSEDSYNKSLSEVYETHVKDPRSM